MTSFFIGFDLFIVGLGLGLLSYSSEGLWIVFGWLVWAGLELAGLTGVDTRLLLLCSIKEPIGTVCPLWKTVTYTLREGENIRFGFPTRLSLFEPVGGD